LTCLDSSDGSDDRLDESLVWDTPDEGDLNYEVDDEIAETERERHEVDNEGKIIEVGGEAA
jgi:hypothetical protein